MLKHCLIIIIIINRQFLMRRNMEPHHPLQGRELSMCREIQFILFLLHMCGQHKRSLSLLGLLNCFKICPLTECACNWESSDWNTFYCHQVQDCVVLRHFEIVENTFHKFKMKRCMLLAYNYEELISGTKTTVIALQYYISTAFVNIWH